MHQLHFYKYLLSVLNFDKTIK